MPKYTSHSVNKRNNQGWNLSGRNAFTLLCWRVKDDRTQSGDEFDRKFFAYMKDLYGKDKQKNETKGKEEIAVEEFDEFEFLDANGLYQPNKVAATSTNTELCRGSITEEPEDN